MLVSNNEFIPFLQSPLPATGFSPLEDVVL